MHILTVYSLTHGKTNFKSTENMFERAKNRKKFPGGVSPDPVVPLAPQRSKSPPNFFHLPTALPPIPSPGKIMKGSLCIY